MPFAISTDGIRIAWRSDSAVPPGRAPAATILLQHGLGLEMQAWDGWMAPLLAAGFRVLRADLRGHGRSDRPAAGSPWSTRQLCDDLDAVLDDAGVGCCHIAGESWGGTAALAFAAARPARVACLAVMSTTFDGTAIPTIRGFAPLVRERGIAAWSRMMLEARFTADVDPALLDWVDRVQGACTPHVIADMSDYVAAESIEPVLAEVGAPVLILAPQGSPFVQADTAADLAARLADAELHRYPGHRHGLVFTGAEIGAIELVAFLQRRG